MGQINSGARMAIVDLSLFLDTGVRLTVAVLAWTLVETLVAAVAGAWLYQEVTATGADVMVKGL